MVIIFKELLPNSAKVLSQFNSFIQVFTMWSNFRVRNAHKRRILTNLWCTIEEAEWQPIAGADWRFSSQGNYFLMDHNMKKQTSFSISSTTTWENSSFVKQYFFFYQKTLNSYLVVICFSYIILKWNFLNLC